LGFLIAAIIALSLKRSVVAQLSAVSRHVVSHPCLIVSDDLKQQH
jgi:hypothetical protein